MVVCLCHNSFFLDWYHDIALTVMVTVSLSYNYDTDIHYEHVITTWNEYRVRTTWLSSNYNIDYHDRPGKYSMVNYD